MGLVYSPTPFGFDREGERLIPSEAEQAVIAQVRLLRARGKTVQSIVVALNTEAVPTKTPGGNWYPSTVRNVLKLPVAMAEAAA